MVLTPDAGPAPSAPPVGVERADTRSYRRLAGTDIDQAMAFFTSDYDLKAPRDPADARRHSVGLRRCHR
ncbi:hypothetical protein [Curtobacterium sp. MCJR17_043]|uniref:hypothetical protein n=1 Tax=Curtobacterium sp. MCJR17_043 TaxID=2175660 RepID=UPI0024DFA7A5|nr:hypothetical protein [Curtobacterium sp. MCJR17_043]WIB35460.1 hypothetical protein DEJ15_14665 [Curtobacterium sp. MCJR17_043]